MTQLSSNDVPSMGRRQFMNLLTFGTATGVALGALYPVANYFMPLRAGGGGGGTSAKDELGNPITKTGWLATHQAGERSLVQGLKGDPTYLIVNEGGEIGEFGLNAICTHLGKNDFELEDSCNFLRNIICSDYPFNRPINYVIAIYIDCVFIFCGYWINLLIRKS